MRTAVSDAISNSGYIAVAVTSASDLSPSEVANSLDKGGFYTTDLTLSNTRTDRSVVFTGIRRDRAWTPTVHRLAPAILLELWARDAEYQPLWNLEAWTSMGLEILTVDDDDASRQLDAVCEILDFERSQTTIKPRQGWSGYGWPGLQQTDGM